MTIYSIEDLCNQPYDDEQIDNVIKSLQYSLIISMFKFMKIDMTNEEIIKFVKTDNWFDKYKWTQSQKTKFKDKMNKMFYNLYRFGPIKCENSSQEWLSKYGFLVKKTYYKNKHNKHNK